MMMSDEVYDYFKEKIRCPACMRLRNPDEFRANMTTGALAKRCIECNAKRKNSKTMLKEKTWGHRDAFMGDYADEPV
jgi:hypothetical protein